MPKTFKATSEPVTFHARCPMDGEPFSSSSFESVRGAVMAHADQAHGDQAAMDVVVAASRGTIHLRREEA